MSHFLNDLVNFIMRNEFSELKLGEQRQSFRRHAIVKHIIFILPICLI